MTTKIENLGVEVRPHSDGGWTVYLFREDTGTGMSVAYSSVYPGVAAEAMAASWRDFLGLPAPEVPVVEEPPAEPIE